jgi:hypothetical protein
VFGVGLEELLEVEVGGGVGDVGRVVADQHAALGLGHAADRRQRFEEAMRMTHAVAAEVLGIASVRRPILVGGKIAALMAAGGEGAAAGEDGVGERAAKALRHQHDNAHARSSSAKSWRVCSTLSFSFQSTMLLLVRSFLFCSPWSVT